MTSQRLMELRRQKEIIEQWLQTPGVPADAHAKLLKMLSVVNTEIEDEQIRDLQKASQ